MSSIADQKFLIIVQIILQYLYDSTQEIFTCDMSRSRQISYTINRMQKILLYYKFIPLADPQAVMLWQKTLCLSLKLKGRILLSQHGINGTVGGEMDDLKEYIKATNAYPQFKGMLFKWSDGTRENFPRLSVKVREELVSFGAADELRINEQGVVGGGKHITPEQVHTLVEKRGGDVVFFDGRNKHEATIGQFKNAIVPSVETTHDFLNELDDPKYDAIKDKPIVTYCTGGIRCEVLSSLMINRGFKEVYQIEGGIVKYGEKYKDDGFWEGALYVFDERMTQRFSDKSKDIADCRECGAKTSNYENCAEVSCNKLVLVCKNCAKNEYYCTRECTLKENQLVT